MFSHGINGIALELLLAATLGPVSHRALFIRGEHHLRAPLYFRALLLFSVLLLLLQLRTSGLNITTAAARTIALLAAFLSSLATSIITYRLFLHPLKAFPGPTLAAVSKLHHSWKVRHSQNHIYLDTLFKQYGEFVRTGPSEITIFHPEALEALHGPANDLRKTDWYDVLRPHVAVNTTRDIDEHTHRRRAWNPSFSGEALPTYDHVYATHVNRLAQVMQDSCGRPTNAKDLIYWWSFDVMGDVMFSKQFGSLDHADSTGRRALETLRRFMALLGPCSPTPWLINLGASIPRVMDEWNVMFEMCKGFMTERMESLKPDDKRSDVGTGEESQAPMN